MSKQLTVPRRTVVHGSEEMLRSELDWFQCEVIAGLHRAEREPRSVTPAWVTRWCGELYARWMEVQRLSGIVIERSKALVAQMRETRRETRPALSGPSARLLLLTDGR